MALPLASDMLDDLPHTPASDVKKHGWRGIMRTVSHSGKVVITNHNDPEAVILSAHEYTLMAEAVRAAQVNASTALETLRRRFDERLTTLNDNDAGDRLRALIGQAVQLDGKVKAGTGY